MWQQNTVFFLFVPISTKFEGKVLLCNKMSCFIFFENCFHVRDWSNKHTVTSEMPGGDHVGLYFASPLTSSHFDGHWNIPTAGSWYLQHQTALTLDHRRTNGRQKLYAKSSFTLQVRPDCVHSVGMSWHRAKWCVCKGGWVWLTHVPDSMPIAYWRPQAGVRNVRARMSMSVRVQV